MNKPVDLPLSSLDEENCNTTSNPTFESVVNARLSRRHMLRGGIGAALGSAFGSLALAGCGGDGDPSPASPTPTETLLAFSAVAKTRADTATVPAGYTATPILATGDPLFADTPAYKNDGTDTGYDRRAGDHHDGMVYFGLSAAGAPDPTSNDRALLTVNHENINRQFLHANGPGANPRPAGETDIEVDCHGVAVVEIRKAAGRFAYVQNSPFNRRITPLTPIELSGPVRGNALLVTKFSPAGTQARGTLNNCGTGQTPWGTLLTGEENWAGYFFRAAGDQALRSAKAHTALARYGRSVTATAAAASSYGWETTGTDDKYARWNTSVTGTTADGSDDYRNEINGQGYVTEIDPYNAASVIKKRTALGRMAHESAVFSRPVVGKPLAVYMGDDSRGEYVYKFVSTAVWQASDATAADRMAVGDKYLDSGKLYAARFNADGTGTWIELSMANASVAGATNYAFADDADVLVHARLAADAVVATKMDRPEWCGVHPVNGDVYFTMTNNSARAVVANSSVYPAVDAANPRAYADFKNGAAAAQQGNVNGHIVRLKETGGEPAATAFNWDVYLFGAESGADTRLVNLSGLTDDQDFSSPDGLVFSSSTGLCWIQTDDGAFTDGTNCMMLAAVPGQQGDGGPVTLNYGAGTVTTRMGRKPSASTLKRFFVAPVDSEVTGLCETPDGKVLFLNVQHPGENTPVANLADPAKFTSHWPGKDGYGAGGANARPRSATLMITKNDGGRIGT